MLRQGAPVPVPGPLWGTQPLRAALGYTPPPQPWSGLGALRRCQALARDAQAHAAQPAQKSSPGALGAALRRHGFGPATLAPALGLVAATAAQVLGTPPYPSQLLAAAMLLNGHLAEMATGEGKTLATALAAATAALAGVPVHVVTANDYLAARDAQALAPLYQALGLTVAALPSGHDMQAKRAAYQCSVLYATGKELAFDHLRQGPMGTALADAAAALAGQAVQAVDPPLSRGLCLALVDECDSILLDEAEVPLVLSRPVPQAARRAFLFQALALARGLREGAHYTLQASDRRATLTPEGEAQAAQASAALGGSWRHARWRREALQQALVALHLLRPDTHYLVRNATVELIDEVTGRVAPGRQWARGLHTLVELKEGVPASTATETLARTSFQRFFQRYWRLAGTSGTLWEARGELRATFGLRVLRVPLRRPSARVVLPARAFRDATAWRAALVQQVANYVQQARPVLVGTDSVADSAALSALLQAAGIAHQVLDARHDAQEAALVAQAGRSGCVTVATRMAGRGTDIVLDARALACGGLAVINAQHNPSARLDRQLAGRAARAGQPGSVQAWWMAQNSWGLPGVLAPILDACNRRGLIEEASWVRPQWLLRGALRWGQWREERRRRALRHMLLQADLAWERRLAFTGPQR